MLSKIFTTVKYCLVVVNFLFLITGIIVLSVGSSVQSAYNEYHQFLSDRFFSLPAFCIATGIIIFLISFAGFYGALMENYYMNMAFVVAMAVIFVFQLSACIAGYALRGNTVALIHQQLDNTMDLYTKDVPVTRLWDEVQRDFECCGVTNASDWLRHMNQSETGQGLPVSCCRMRSGVVATFTCNVNDADVYATGCAEAFGNWVRGHAGSIGIAGVFLVFMQALAVGGAVWIAKMSRDDVLP